MRCPSIGRVADLRAAARLAPGEEGIESLELVIRPCVYRGEKTHYAASLISAADQEIPGDIRVVLEELITEVGR
jgi:hypothetical protein